MDPIDSRQASDAWQPLLPPWTTTESGALRRVGVELELIGPSVAEVAQVVVEVLGGRAEAVSRYESVVRGDEAGPWRIELDYDVLKEKGRERTDSGEPASFTEELSEAVLRTGAEVIVPVEVVSPPLPMPRLADVQRLLPALRSLGTLGTHAGLMYAFGLQLNPELPRTDAGTILRYLRAFLCLQDWLVKESQVDLTRRMTRFMAPFPTEYVQRVVQASYAPTLEQLISDYLESNPTRNRAVDLLPLFMELDAERVRAVVHDTLVKARPTFHYRLPNCEIDDPAWGIHVPWNRWLQVEHLAADEERLDAACAAYAEFLARPMEKLLGNWAEGVEPWLTPLAGR